MLLDLNTRFLRRQLRWSGISSALKEINSEYSLEVLILKLQYFGHLMQRANSLEKTLMLRKTEGRRRKGRQKMRWLDGITDSMDLSLSELWEMVRTGKPGVWQSMGSQLDMTERLNNKLRSSQCLGTQHGVECFSGQLPFAYSWCTPLYTFPILFPFPIGPEEDVSPFYRQGNCSSSKVPTLTHANK